jgi:hypothetical protein
MKYERQIQLPVPTRASIFAVVSVIIFPYNVSSIDNVTSQPLEELMVSRQPQFRKCILITFQGFDGEKGAIPRVVKDCIQFLHETGTP